MVKDLTGQAAHFTNANMCRRNMCRRRGSNKLNMTEWRLRRRGVSMIDTAKLTSMSKKDC